MLTAAMKLARRKIEETYAKEIEEVLNPKPARQE
jgi:hypothetical protein